MTQYKSSSDLKDLAKETLKGKYGVSMLVSPVLQAGMAFAFLFPIMFLYFFVYTILVTMETMGGVSPTGGAMFIFVAIYLFLMLICGLLISVLNVGVVYFNLNLACGKTPRVSDLFCGFRYHFKKALTLSAIQTLPALLLMFPYILCSVIWVQSDENLWLAGMILAGILYVVIWSYIQLCWSQSYYLLSDFPQTSTMGLLKLSNRIMKGHKGRLLYIQFSFLPLDFLCSCSSGIGQLWCTPYKNMTYTQFFLDLMQPTKHETVNVKIPEPVVIDTEPIATEIVDAEIVDTEIIETENASELF